MPRIPTDAPASPTEATRLTLPAYSIRASPYIREFTKFISRVHTDAPSNVATEVLEVISGICRQYPSRMQRPSIHDTPAGRAETVDDETIIDTSHDGQDVKMEISVDHNVFPAYSTSHAQRSALLYKQVAPNNPLNLDPNDARSSHPAQPSHPTRPYTPASTPPPNPPSQELVQSSNIRLDIDERYTQLGVPDIYSRAFNLLNGRRISVTKNNRVTEATLTTSQAYDIVNVFFSEMFCTTHKRIQDIAIQDVFNSLSAIARRDTPSTLDYLVQNIDNVKLRNSWEQVRVSLATGDKSSRQYIDYLGLGTPTRGKTFISLAKKALCEEVGISTYKFESYLRNSIVPAALTRHFGPGSLLFFPNNMSGNRHRFRYPSAADEIFSVIKSADTKNLLGSWSKTLRQYIVQPVWDRTPLRLAVGSPAAVDSERYGSSGYIEELEEDELEEDELEEDELEEEELEEDEPEEEELEEEELEEEELEGGGTERPFREQSRGWRCYLGPATRGGKSRH
ncbi:hypothetical protein C8A00DRAFT_30422 [Chaetomidium leptoderma]|uniref:Uncharacterized protein n=1 Tax=Chaetomidium leptoderma TaxID=669021 RepID=A0AAN6VRU3_9PEZI|nr:hypothetical protein C8A00DRAFT_30422 [Chaetomidium leptoderma]